MKTKWLFVIGVAIVLAIGTRAVTRTWSTASPPTDASIETPQGKVSYAVGVVMARSFKRPGVALEVAAVEKGLRDALEGGTLAMSEQDVQKTLMTFRSELQQKAKEAMKVTAAAAKQQTEVFLAENAKKPGVVTLPSGLQYKVLKAGAGKKPASTDTVECQYRGTRVDGTEFDSSYKRGQPSTLKMTGLIHGWQEALPMMPVGSKWQLFVPPSLAYGERGSGSKIPPNATLIFEIELLGIKS
ncbi:MAG: FKBP-type peptidyl-prolyl cis-trans isomerase FklB [Myxococcales bacterium]|nr:FKBP-type peptidyl-prolyl cis-trans isomerase FklB [Myxococcales bacterium]